jgi:E3 ubiquitin-protein ligase BRE1
LSSGAEGRAAAPSSQGQESFDSSAQSESDARVELDKAQRALEQYERVLGPNPEAAEDISVLAKRLEKVIQEKSTLELKLGEAEAVRSR